PDTGDARRKQATYEGSDRQARGAVLRALRDADGDDLPLDRVIADWPDPRQRDRAIDSLIADGLAEAVNGALRLPRGSETVTSG
ncbi:MAG: A/G-specific adenine glycosylase, partial [Microbacterium sp.]|nr:A/G-specific adenine glycosylase [Microbacterium sp.]